MLSRNLHCDDLTLSSASSLAFAEVTHQPHSSGGFVLDPELDMSNNAQWNILSVPVALVILSMSIEPLSLIGKTYEGAMLPQKRSLQERLQPSKMSVLQNEFAAIDQIACTIRETWHPARHPQTAVEL